MRISLKSLMALAHYFKRDLRLDMATALKMAWAKAKGFEYVTIIARVSADRSKLDRKCVFGYDFDSNHIDAVRTKNSMHAEHMAGVWKIIGSEQHRLFQFA